MKKLSKIQPFDSKLLNQYLTRYVLDRPIFLSLIRAKEAVLFKKFSTLQSPILDVGVGDGFFAKTAFGTLDAGIDLTESRMREAKTLQIYKELKEYDGIHIPYGDKIFQTVVSNCVLEHVKDLPKLLKEIHRVTKKNGHFITTVMAKPWEEYLFGRKLFGKKYSQWMRKKQVHLNVLTDIEWRKLFIQSGFSIKEEIGYLTPTQCAMIDICHYLSVPNLISYILFKQWVLFPWMNRIFPIRLLCRIFTPLAPRHQSGAIFYVLQKK